MRSPSAKERVARLAKRQFGRVTQAQLRQLEIPSVQITRWTRDGYLHKVLPRVYAVGHRAQDVEADLMAAVLYAGPGAALSHSSAAWWLGLLKERPRLIQVSTPRRCRSAKGIRVYGRRSHERVLHRDLPTTTHAQTLVDLAATTTRRTLRTALANAEYHKVLDLEAIEQTLNRGTLGAKKLRAALEQHQPRLALTKSDLEKLFIEICELRDISLPEINAKVAGWEVDAYWPEARLAVEVDGHGNHHTPAHLRRDRRKEKALRDFGLTVVRYSDDQLENEQPAIAEELSTATNP